MEKASKGEIMTNVCEICGCENPATRMYEKEGEVFRMICDFHDKQVNEKKLDQSSNVEKERDDVYFDILSPYQNPYRRGFSKSSTIQR